MVKPGDRYARLARRNRLVAALVRLNKGDPGWGGVWRILGLDEGRCSCGATIWWTVTQTGRRMPLSDKGVSHFADCPHANGHRKK